MNALVFSTLQRRGLKVVPIYTPADYVLCLGAQALRVMTGLENLAEIRGELLCTEDNRLAWATFQPAMVLRNRRLLPLFRQDLEDFASLIRFNEGTPL